MHCVESMEEIGTHCNLILFTYQHILYIFYKKPSMKMAGRVSSFSVIVVCQVTETVVEAIFLCSCPWIKCPCGHIYFSNDIYVSYDCIYSPLCCSSSISPTSI